jgi:hypothetical protein
MLCLQEQYKAKIPFGAGREKYDNGIKRCQMCEKFLNVGNDTLSLSEYLQNIEK